MLICIPTISERNTVNTLAWETALVPLDLAVSINTVCSMCCDLLHTCSDDNVLMQYTLMVLRLRTFEGSALTLREKLDLYKHIRECITLY